MPPRFCCCEEPGCELGADDFNRTDANPPSGSWREITGEFEILDNTVNTITPGKLATTICHPAWATEGSFRADFLLVDLRTRSIFSVGAGNPDTSTYRVTFEPIDMDLVTAKIRVTVIGDVTDTFDFLWPDDGFGDSVNTLAAHICFLPGVMLRGSIGTPPAVDVCAELYGGTCFNVGGHDVGPFFFVDGRFDNWVYETLIIDNFECPPCACFCFRRAGAAKEFSCFQIGRAHV